MKQNAFLHKRNKQSITIFQYYTKQLFPNIFNAFDNCNKSSKQLRTNYRNICYNYCYDSLEGFKNIDEQIVIRIGRKVYLTPCQSIVSDSRAIKSTAISLKYIPVSSTLSEEMELVILNDVNTFKEYGSTSSTSTCLGRSKSQKNPFKVFHQTKQVLNSNRPTRYKNDKSISLYIIHHYKNTEKSRNSQEWLNFIQKYQFYYPQVQYGQSIPTVTHQVVFSYSVEDNSLLNFAPKFLQSYLEQCCPFVQGKSVLLNSIVTETKKILKSSVKRAELVIKNASFDPVHRRQLRLKEQHKRVFTELKPKIYSYFETINPTRKPNPYFLENTLCRLMENNSYKLQDSWQAVKHYLDFEKRLRQKYVWEDFEQYHKMNIFNYIGKTNSGHPILLNRLRNCLMSRITDKELFADYHLYLFEVYMQDQMQGWVDELDALIDGADQVNDNTDIMFTKGLFVQLAKFTLGRSNQFTCFNVGILGKLLIKLLAAFLPERILKNIQTFKPEQQQELLNHLRKSISDEVIPDFLGGLNQQTLFEQKRESKSINKSTLNTIQNSFVSVSIPKN